MYPNPIPLNNGTSDVNYDFRGSQPEASAYKNNGALVAHPQTFNIAHSYTGKNSTTVRRSKYRLDRVTSDGASTGTISVYLVVQAPVGIFVDNTELLEELNKMKDFLSNTGYLDKIANAEI